MADALRDLLERVGWTAVQAFLGAYVALAATTGVEWDTIFWAGAISAAVAVGKVVAVYQFGAHDKPRSRAREFVERVGWTFVQAFAGVWAALAVTDAVDWSATLYAALVAGGVAAAKTVIAFQFGVPGSGALPETYVP
jgi:hypothetical protein